MSPRARTILSWTVTVVILALVIVGLWAFTAPKTQTTPPTITLSPAQQSQQAYNDGLQALSKDQTSTALASFKKAVALDPTNEAAQKALASAQSSSSSSSSSSSGSTTTTKKKTPAPATSSVWTKSLTMVKLLPTVFEGYGVGPASSGAPTEVEVSATANRASSPVQGVVWYIHDLGTTAKAAAFITGVSKKAYPSNGASVPVNDVTGYFGTAAGGQSTVAFTRGRYVFEVITSAPPASTLDARKAVSVMAAEAFATQP